MVDIDQKSNISVPTKVLWDVHTEKLDILSPQHGCYGVHALVQTFESQEPLSLFSVWIAVEHNPERILCSF